MESCHLAAARRLKLWSLNANLFLEEPHQLTKFAQQVHSNHIWQRTLPFKALISIFWDLQPLWSCSLTEPDLLRFGWFSGHVLSETKSVTTHFFYISDITNSSSFDGKIFRKKSMLENFRANVLKEARKGFYLHARAQSTHAITKMHASAESVLKSAHRKLMLRKIARTGNKICGKHLFIARKFARWPILIFCIQAPFAMALQI